MPVSVLHSRRSAGLLTSRKNLVSLFVDRPSHRWIVLDPDGNFWNVSHEFENPWEERKPFFPMEETELEPVPGHYKHMLGLPT
jgi:hypothetical protein